MAKDKYAGFDPIVWPYFATATGLDLQLRAFAMNQQTWDTFKEMLIQADKMPLGGLSVYIDNTLEDNSCFHGPEGQIRIMVEAHTYII